MDLPQLLNNTRAENIERALQSLHRNGLLHYPATAKEQNRQRLRALYDVTVQCVTHRTLAPIKNHARSIAQDRFRDGFDLQEVHTAFNVLEEALWHTVTEHLPPQQYPEGFGLVSTVLGAGKQALAVEYVAKSNPKTSFQSLDLSALFRGTA